MTINTNYPCEIGEVIGPLYAMGADEPEHVRMMVVRVATHDEWQGENPTISAPFRHGFYYLVSAD